jgi:hypothetical protein
VRETPAELTALQQLLDRSFEAGGEHLRDVITPERRLTAEQVAARLTGMRLLSLATSTADGRPLVGPVDGIFLHGAFHFGTSPQSLRWRHILARPHVSATHLPGEELAITVHGRAVQVPVDDGTELRGVLREIYGPRYGQDYEDMLDSGAVYARIDAERMFTFQMNPEDG